MVGPEGASGHHRFSEAAWYGQIGYLQKVKNARRCRKFHARPPKELKIAQLDWFPSPCPFGGKTRRRTRLAMGHGQRHGTRGRAPLGPRESDAGHEPCVPHGRLAPRCCFAPNLNPARQELAGKIVRSRGYRMLNGKPAVETRGT